MTNKEAWDNIRHDHMRFNGVVDPIKIDNFVCELYSLMKERDFSIVEADEIIKTLSDMIANDKKTILRESLKTVEKYNKEGK